MHDEFILPQGSGHHGDPASMRARGENPDLKELVTVGIDIGTSTSHLMLSRIVLLRNSLELSSRFDVVDRDVLFRSPVILTPYVDKDTIDTHALAHFITHSYEESGMNPSQVDTGAVICTGEAVKKKNSEAIVRLFADQGGKFVCATAGHNLEAVLAAHGSGAVDRSHENTVVNADLGGGTCKLAIVKKGVILETSAINLGSRLIAWDKQGKVNRIEEAGAKIAQWAGVPLEMGKVLSQQDKVSIAEITTDLLFEFFGGKKLSPRAEELLVTPAAKHDRNGAQLLFSGGVSEYIYGRDTQDYGDLGPTLAASIKKRLPQLGLKLAEPGEGLRATVIGASQYTIQVSSSTIFLSRNGLLPIRDLLVVTPSLDNLKEPSVAGVARAIKNAFVRYDLLDNKRPTALFLRYPWPHSYNAWRTLGEAILSCKDLWGHQDPLVLIAEADVGRLVGAILKEELELEQDVVAIDEITVGEFDFVDIGEELSSSRSAVPVVVKSLVFK